MPRHPNEVLFEGEKPFPIIPTCEHFAGTEERITKALELQNKMGGVFDITMDCEDGAPMGAERPHAEMVVRMQNSAGNQHNMSGVRIHDYTNEHWKQDIDIIVSGAAERFSHITVPKTVKSVELAEMIDYVRNTTSKAGSRREIPIHALVETHGALRQVWEIAELPNVQVLDFGMMDFVSAHNGAIPAFAMRSPYQFDHKLLQRAKAEMVAAALASGVVPAHNVTLELKDVEFIYNDARRAHDEFGFLRQWSIYPAQIEPITRAMAPSHHEVEEAEAILLKAFAADWSPIQHEGNLHDRATYRYYWQQLQRAHIQNVALGQEVKDRFFAEAVTA
ncbi:aldolase/citrate lyase family protein [Candidatus Amarobacter glycogenicus]|uniref:HpcH/HpaI aldolase/citrate lyase family protein n=1 Tax=Candidatus Amarobacter glycogenicus TaxID=3140699 RepID=UPI003136BE72|nr:CoA ester lyase [Dehalococcoidia bacterium]